MPTQEQIDDVLAKVTTYREKKALSDPAQAAAATAGQLASDARAAWDAALLAGGSCAALTAKLLAVITTAIDAAAKQADASDKSTTASQSLTAVNDALYALINSTP